MGQFKGFRIFAAVPNMAARALRANNWSTT